MDKKTTSKYYFAYGSNLNSIHMHYRCHNAKVVGTSLIKNYRLSFKGAYPHQSYLTIEPCEGSYVPIGIYIILPTDEIRLDKYECYPKLYYKEEITVELSGKKITGIIYIMNKSFEEMPPSSHYYEICQTGYQIFHFDQNLLIEALIRAKENHQRLINKYPFNKKDC